MPHLSTYQLITAKSVHFETRRAKKHIPRKLNLCFLLDENEKLLILCSEYNHRNELNQLKHVTHLVVVRRRKLSTGRRHVA